MFYISDIFNYGKKLNQPTLTAKLEQEAEWLNRESAHFWYNYILEIALNRYTWKNLPSEIDPRFLELILTLNGTGIFFKDYDLDEYMTLEYTSYGRPTIYMEPVKRRAFSVGVAGNNKIVYENLNRDNSIIIWNNATRTNDLLALRLYAQRLTDIDRAIDVNIRGQKTPKIIKCSRETQLTLENLLRKYDGNIPFIFGTKTIDTLNDFGVIDTTVPYVADKLHSLKKSVVSDMLTYFGVENAPTEKKEREISDVVLSNLGAVSMGREAGLKARKEGCRKINEMFGLDLDVEFSQTGILERGFENGITENGEGVNNNE